MLGYTKREWSHVWGFGAVLVFTILLSSTANAEKECTSDFFSHKTCTAFDDMELRKGVLQSGSEEDIAGGVIFGLGSVSFVGDEKNWYHGFSNEVRLSGSTLDTGEFGNEAIHSFRCSMDLFGNISCDSISRLSD